MKILVTRPVEDAGMTGDLVESLGFQVIVAPCMAVHDVRATLPDPTLYKGIIFSSANGVRSFQRQSSNNLYRDHYADIPVFAVGEHTASNARAAGFKTVHAGEGTLESLIPVIRGALDVPARLLHLHGRDKREDPRHYLTLNDGWAVDGAVLYETRLIDSMDPAVVESLRKGEIGAVLLYSAKSAECFITALRHNWKDAALKGVKALCLADSVVESARQLDWGEILVAPRPDQNGMIHLLKSLKTMTRDSTPPSDSGSAHSSTSGDAEKIIERFGGIRPMATKMGIPVTTVQGWKKRNAIPENRQKDVLAAAKFHQVDLSGLMGKKTSASAFTEDLAQAGREQEENPESLKPHQEALEAARATEAQEEARIRSVAGAPDHPVGYDAIMAEVKKAQIQAVRRSVVATFAVVVLFGVGAGLLVVAARQQVEKNQARIVVLEETVEKIGDTPQPDMESGNGMGAKLAELRGRAEELQATISGLKAQAETLIGPQDASLSERLSTLEQNFQGLIGGNSDLSLVVQRIQEMQASLQGQQQMQSTVEDLQGLIFGLQGRVDHLDSALEEEQKSDSALAQALEGVSPEELKAAAMLIGLSQFRDSMNRSGPFETDLALLQKMLGDKDPALNEAIEHLAPYAEKGVLSPAGLSGELKGLAGDIVVSSIKGEDVSIQERALGRFQDVLKIQKDGEVVLGTDTQATVVRAQKMLDDGDVDAAIIELQTLQGPALETAQPLIDEAQITAMAQQVRTMLTSSVMGQIRMNRGGRGSVPYTASTPLFGGVVVGNPGFMGPSVSGSLPGNVTPEAQPEIETGVGADVPAENPVDTQAETPENPE